MAPGARAGEIELLGETTIARRPVGLEAPVGGLSALSYDAAQGVYHVLSDDAGRLGAPRMYRMTIDLSGSTLEQDDVTVERAVVLRRADGSTFPRLAIDPEGLARTPRGHWIVASEGHVDSGVPSALLEFDAEGRWIGALRLPRAFRPRPGRGVRHNQALESATVSPDGRWLFTAVESALIQDGLAATASDGSPCRLLRIDLETRRVVETYVYRTEPIADEPKGEAFAVNGLVDLLALDGDRLLALERSFTVGRGNVVRLFLVDLGRPGTPRRHRVGWRGFKMVAKREIIDIARLGVVPDNLEAMTWGPDLPDGRRALVLVADDNFNPGVQRNQLVVLAVEPSSLGRAVARPAN